MTRRDQWVCIYSTTLLHNAELLRHILHENEIEAVVLNQKDSFYPVIGDVQVFVKPDDVIRAKKTLEDSAL